MRVSIAALLLIGYFLSGNLSVSAAQTETSAGKVDSSKLYAGATHSSTLPHVKQSLDKHKQALQGGLKMEVAKTDVADPPADPVRVPEPEGLSTEAEKDALGAVPETGVACPAKHLPVLSGNVQDFVAEWFRIPSWLSGKWWKEGDLTVSLVDLRNGRESFPNEWVENKMEAVWGHQKDASGQVWHVNLLPSERDGKSGNNRVKFLTNMQKVEKSDEESLVTRTHYLVSESNFLTGQPVEMFQQESLNHYLPSGANQVMNVSTNRVFTYQGMPVRDGKLQSRMTKVGPFSPTASINGLDLKTSLNDYLKESGMSHLMTEQEKE